MLLGHVFSNDKESLSFKDSFEVILFILFPITYLIGLGIAFKWRLFGGVISTLALVILFCLRVDILFVPMFAIALFPPAALCIVDGMKKRKSSH